MPTHHQDGFIAELRSIGFDIVVHYYNRVSTERVNQGWLNYDSLACGEIYVAPKLSSLYRCTDWRERIHIVPGYGTSFLLGLAVCLSLHGIAWLHWSEASRSYTRSWRGDVIRKAYAMLVNRFALGALAIGDMARADFRRWGIRDDRIHYLPYSTPALRPTSSEPFDPSAGTVRFLFVGALCYRKGIDILLRAFSIVRRDHRNARLTLLGADQENKRYHRLAESLGLDGAVAFRSAVPAAEVVNVIYGCDVFVLPSRFDGWGVVVNEAASLGKAVIATSACGAACHLVRNGQNGFVVAPENVEQLAECMANYCDDRRLIDRHGDVSRQLFDDVSPERNARRFREILLPLTKRELPQ